MRQAQYVHACQNLRCPCYGDCHETGPLTFFGIRLALHPSSGGVLFWRGHKSYVMPELVDRGPTYDPVVRWGASVLFEPNVDEPSIYFSAPSPDLALRGIEQEYRRHVAEASIRDSARGKIP